MTWIRVNKKIVPKGFRGITLFPFIFLSSEILKKNRVIINHEKIHIKQQKELLVVFFYIIYGIDYLIKLIKYKDKHKAYVNIIFEREAYGNQYDLEYLKKRKLFAYWRK
ncbi:MAG: hypothetical protein KGV59_07640 [Tenacibaculum sp.]|nr:hypothetical protein [Tenacibaculum sp.]